MNTYIITKSPYHLYTVAHSREGVAHAVMADLTYTQARAMVDSLTALAEDLTASPDSGCIVRTFVDGETEDYWSSREGYVAASDTMFGGIDSRNHQKPFVIDTTNQDGHW